jgi:uncharacterized OsmC-like protein
MEPTSTARNYTVHARSTDTVGRVLCNARDHHFVVDGPVHNGCPGEAITPAEVFLSAVAACGVELIQVIANEQKVELRSVGVHITGTIDRDHPVRTDVTLFNSVHLRFNLNGVTQWKGEELVDLFKARCPLFGTVAVATPEVRVEVTTTE